MRHISLVLSLLFALGHAASCTPGSNVSRELGARCQSHDECDDVCLPDPEFPDGFCSVNCNSAADCPGGARCVAIGQGVCLFGCLEPTDCEFLGPGWRCATTPALPGGEEDVCVGP